MKFNDIEIKMFPAGAGDSILIRFPKENFNILIDGGYIQTYSKYLKPYFRQMRDKGQKLNLVICTHIDRDHISGIKRFLQENGNAAEPSIIPVDEIWFNGFRSMPIPIVNDAELSFQLLGILGNMASENCEYLDNGDQNISFLEGNCLAEIITRYGYCWNMPFSKAVTSEHSLPVEYGKIRIHVLNPRMEDLNRLALKWTNELKRNYKGNLIISDNHLFEQAFEGCLLYDDYLDAAYNENISFRRPDLINWKQEAEKADDKPDNSLVNLSSIVVLIEYNGVNMLFTGDCPLYKIEYLLPNNINVVKLPHHGSGKSTKKEFVKNYIVGYYLLSSDGSYGHPSKVILANIICHSKGNPIIVTNYHFPFFEGISAIQEELGTNE